LPEAGALLRTGPLVGGAQGGFPLSAWASRWTNGLRTRVDQGPQFGRAL